MGIRIHKMIGYGIDDVKYDSSECKITDRRFSKNGFMCMDWEKREETFTDEVFDQYLDEEISKNEDGFGLKILRNTRRDILKNSKNGKYSYKDSIFDNMVHDAEFGMENVILFTPPYFGKSWKRYDDIIDYYEPTHHEADGGIGTGITLLNRSIWPFESYVDCRTMPPKRLNKMQWQLFVDSRNSEKYGEKMAEWLVEEMNFKSVAEMKQMIRPIIPEELVVLLKYLNVFEKEEYIHQLKPMLYWYWV